MSLVYLFLAILFEVIGTTSLKLSQGFTRPLPSVVMVLCYAASFGILALALKKLDVGTAYAIWSGLGTALIATIGVLWFKEPLTVLKVASIVLIVLGVVGLNVSGGAH